MVKPKHFEGMGFLNDSCGAKIDTITKTWEK